MSPLHNNISYHLLRVNDEPCTLLNGSHTLSQVIDQDNHLHNVGTLNPYFSNCNHRSQKFTHMAHKIRDEETALCMQIRTACIPEYNDRKKM